jgi:hypothetical protein
MTEPDRSEKIQGSRNPSVDSGQKEKIILPPTQEVNKGARILLGDVIAPQIVHLPDGSSPMKISNGVIQLDEDALNLEKKKLTDSLRSAIEAGDDKMLQIYLGNLQGDDEALVEARNLLKEAFASKNADKLELKSLSIDLATGGIAERNLIRQGLRAELPRIPFSFKDERGQNINVDEIDYVFSRKEGKSDSFKLIVGFSKGIRSIGVVDDLADLGDDKFQPDLLKASKDSDGVVAIPIKEARDGTEPTATIIEIRLGPIDIVSEIRRQQEEGQRRKKEEEDERERRNSYRPSSSSYNSVSR